MTRTPRALTAFATALGTAAVGLVGGTSSVAAATSRTEVTPFVSATSAGPHALEVKIIRSKFQTKIVGYKIYLSRNTKTPSALGKLPSRSPDRVYAPSHVPTDVTLTFSHLKKLTPYMVVAYGYDKRGHVGGSYSLGYPVDSGFHITGTAFYLHKALGGAFVLASKGRERMLGVVPTEGDNARQIYAAGSAGSGHWTKRSAPGDFTRGTPTVQLLLGTDGRTVDARLSSCARAGTAQASVTATAMPAADNLWTSDYCNSVEDEPIHAEGIVPLADNKILLAATATPASGEKTAEYLTGRPNGTLSAAKLPDGESYLVKDVTRDASTGTITILGSSQTEPYGTVIWQGTPSEGFSGPTTISDVPGSEASMVAGNGKLYITFDTTSGIELVSRNASGHTTVAPLPHTTKYDAFSLLYFNNATGHLHAAWTARAHPRCVTRCGGIQHETLVGGQWGSARFFTHWSDDYATSIQVTSSDRTLIGYIRG